MTMTTSAFLSTAVVNAADGTESVKGKEVMYASYVDDHAARALKHPWCRLLVAWAIIPMPVAQYSYFL